MKVITVGREFGSGGREFGKRLAEELGFAYYDEEILSAIAKKSGLAQSYVNSVVENTPLQSYPITYGKTFFMFNDVSFDAQWKVIQTQNDVLKELAQKSDCVFVGRCSDVVLDKLNPLKIFLYSDMESKLARCKEKAPEGENLTDKELLKKIKETNKKRERYYRDFSERTWGAKENYHLCINTSGKEIKDLVPTAAAFCQAWFK